MFSKACEYAIRATLYIAGATANDQRVTVKDIASEVNAPEAFPAKILQKLVRDGHIASLKGPGGGFSLTEARARKLHLDRIVMSIDGDGVYTGCALGLSHCSDKRPCPLHEQFKEVRSRLRDLLEKTSVHELSTGLGVRMNTFSLKG